MREQNLGTDVPIAIVGMAARAAGAPDLDLLWRLIEAGQDAITDIPADRLPGFDAERLEAKAPRAGLLDRIDTFDAGFFGLSPRQAAYTDPRQRLLLEEAWHAIEDAGIAPDTLAGSATGVYVGSTGADFRLRCDGLGAIDQYTASGTMDAFLANRISYHLDARGCSTEVNTACSSGLAAIVQAAWALAAGQIDTAIAAGASIICHGFDQEAYLRAGILSPTGQARPFSEDANGYVRGEGVAVVVMKRLADAQRDGDPVRAVIRGTSQSHDGRSGGQFSPTAQTQAALIRLTARKAGISPAELGYIEAHATGTKVGDRAEATGLVMALDGARRTAGPQDRLWLGALKAAIGHTEGAAGIFGLIKAVLVLEHDLIPAVPGLVAPQTSLVELGPVLGFPTAPVAWPRTAGLPRLVGVSSFGLGGANAHVVISDPPATAAPVTRPGGPGPRVFPLSAATASALTALTGSLREWLRAHPTADLTAVAWTLQTGRAALPCRVVLSEDAVLSRDHGATAAGSSPDPVDENDVVAAFLAGKAADWPGLWDGGRVPRVNGLPLYPFEAQSHWPRAERPPAAMPPRPPLPPRQAVARQAVARQAVARQAVARQAVSPPGLVPAGLVRLMPLEPVATATPRVSAVAPPPVPVPAPLPQPASPAPAPAADPGELARTIAALAAEVLYLDPGKVTPETDLVAAGLDSVLAVEFTQLVQAKTGLEVRIEQIYATGTSRALAAELSPEPGAATPSTEPRPVPDGATSHPGADRLIQRLRKLAGECLYLPEDQVDTSAELTAIGLDSVLAVEFLAKLNSECGTSLALSEMYEGQTLSGLATALARLGTDA